VPFHEPVAALSVCPCCALPLIVGALADDGATTDGDGEGDGDGAGAGAGTGATNAVCGDEADADPFLFVAVTTTAIAYPTSAALSA